MGADLQEEGLFSKWESWALRRLSDAYSNLSVNYATPLLEIEDLEKLLGEDFVPE